MAASNELVVVFSDLGHARSANEFADGFWALDDPKAIVDFAYTGVHKTIVASKAIVNAFYGQAPKYSYYNGCSDGGREGLHELQRYPGEFDGAIIGAPVIDEIATNSQWHAYFWRVNQNSAGQNILLANKGAVLNNAVRAACGQRLNDGTYDVLNDFRSCHFDAQTLASPSCDPTSTDACLTPAQAAVADAWWSGVVANGQHLTPGGAPYGSERYWGLPATATTPASTLGDFIFSNDFPNIMASFDAPTGLTGSNMKFTEQEFYDVHELTGIYDPTNPDLTAYQAKGGRVIFWSGWADSGASPYMVLNYYAALGRQIGTGARDAFTKLYMIPGAGHCASNKDLYSPLLNWVELNQTPGQVNVSSIGQGGRDRPVWPHPALTVYNPATDSFVQGGPSTNSDRFQWLGLSHYTTSHTTWCTAEGSSKPSSSNASVNAQTSSWTMTCGVKQPNDD
jgi:feruloyl esterase